MGDTRTCRLCGRDVEGGVKYGVRHYAHGRCYLIRYAGLGATHQRVVEALDLLPIGALVNFRPVLDFDDPSQLFRSFASIGMTSAEFLDYYNGRQAVP